MGINGSDITITEKDLLKCAVVAARLGKNRLKKVDKIPKMYDGYHSCYGRMDLDITFDVHTYDANTSVHKTRHSQATLTI